MKIGFIGLGHMGNPMAANVLNAGYDLTIHDLHRMKGHHLEEAGAIWADTPEAVASQSEVVLTSLPSPHVVETVVLGDKGVFAGLAPGSVYLDTSTNEPSVMRRIARIGAKREFRVLDAPISGGMSGAMDASLTIFVGGVEADLERVRPVLESIGEQIIYMGHHGSGNVIKLINNMMMFVSFLGVCEGVAMGAKAGVDLKLLLNAITPSMGQSRIFERTLSLFLSGRKIGSTTDLAVKDMRMVVELGEELGVPLEVSPLVRDMFTRFRDAGDRGSEEFTEMIQDFLKRSGAEG